MGKGALGGGFRGLEQDGMGRGCAGPACSATTLGTRSSLIDVDEAYLMVSFSYKGSYFVE